MAADVDRARSALAAIPPDLPRDDWHRVGRAAIAAGLVYVALEGEAGFKLRAQAWEASRGRRLPAGLRMLLQAFKLTEPQDVADLAAVVPAGAVVFIDTLNRAAPTADERRHD